MTATSQHPHTSTDGSGHTFSIDETATALGVSPAPGNELVRAGRVGSVMAGRLISRGHLDALPAGDGA